MEVNGYDSKKKYSQEEIDEMVSKSPYNKASAYRDWETIDRKSTRLNSSHRSLSRMPSSA